MICRLSAKCFGLVFVMSLLLGLSPAGGQAAAAATSGAAAAPAQPEVRIKDITQVLGARDNQLVGLGLVVGLNGTGDGTGSQASVEMVTNMLRQFGVTVDPTTLRTRNAAAVMVTCNLPAFSRIGSTIDVTVSSLGDARSLTGGVLLQTPLQGADNQVYAVAQGVVTIGGASDPAGRVVRTHTLSATVVDGAVVEQELAVNLVENGKVTLVLADPDFSTASRIAAAINSALGGQTALALDKYAVEVSVPAAYRNNAVDFIAAVEELPVQPDAPARVVINERTGTVVIGAQVRIAPVVVAHGALSVRIAADTAGAAGAAASPTTPQDASWTWRQEDESEQALLLSGAKVEDVVAGLNAIGATPKDIIALLQAIKAAGALYGELIVL